LASDLGQGEFSRLVREVDVFELLAALGRDHRRLEFRRQLALSIDRPEDGLLAVGELTGPNHGLLDPPHGLFVEAAGLIAAITSDEGNRIVGIEQVDDRLHANGRNVQPPRNDAQINDRGDRRRSHPMCGPCGCFPQRARRPSSALFRLRRSRRISGKPGLVTGI